ncbi:hypothetical protein U1Q18_045376, partial [Sarracenia purpurea var. burkii]
MKAHCCSHRPYQSSSSLSPSHCRRRKLRSTELDGDRPQYQIGDEEGSPIFLFLCFLNVALIASDMKAQIDGALFLSAPSHRCCADGSALEMELVVQTGGVRG